MLGAHPIYPVLLATDLASAKDFYHVQLGLEILSESAAAITFGCGGGTQLSVTKSTVGTADTIRPGHEGCRALSSLVSVSAVRVLCARRLSGVRGR